MHRIIVSAITCPYLNLAIENELLLNVQKEQRMLFIFRNDPCVVIGRFQNPWIECNLALMSKHGIELVRRQSGGGTVYHDLSNVNFSFIADREIHSQKLNHQILIAALNNLSIPAYATPRGDVRLNDGSERKISGSAFKQKRTQAFHHGTMLINSNLERLLTMISSHRSHLPSKSIASIRSVVANICEINPAINHEVFQAELIKEFSFLHGDINVATITMENLTQKHFDYAAFLKHASWKWFETPRFEVSHSILLAEDVLNIKLVLNKGKIEQWTSNLCQESLANYYHGRTLELSSFTSLDETMALADKITLINQWIIQYFDLEHLP